MNRVLRVATFVCSQCHCEAKTVCTVWQDGVQLLWCESCVKAGGIQVARETCQRCGGLAVATSDVWWRGCYRIWCQHCVEEHQGGILSSRSTPEESLLPQPVPLLNDRYRLLVPVGRGGFGAVYKAEDTYNANRIVAVKEMDPGAGSHVSSIKAVFDREACMLAGLRHAQLPHIYDYFTVRGRYYLVMDYIEGQTLEQHVKRAPDGRIALALVINYGIQLCDVLIYLHGRTPHPIVFRDLKPSNVILGADGILYLIDFGIARFFKFGQTHDTMGFVSPGYAAPEQYGEGQTTVRADIYSLGATLHYLLSGTSPAQHPFFFAPLGRSNEAGWADTERLIFQMVSMSVERRPSSVADIREELRRIRALLPKAEGSVSGSRASSREVTVANSLGRTFYCATTLPG
jgi:serine/threonine protein kinase